MLKFNITHKTIYTYESEATESYSRLKISPLETLCQNVNSHSIELKPDVPVFSHRDFFDNQVYEFSLPFRHNHLEITARSEVTTFQASKEPLKSQITVKEAANWFQDYSLEFFDYRTPSTFAYFSQEVFNLSQKIFTPNRKLVDAIMELNRIFTKEFKYKSGATSINTPIDEAIKKRMGVCQDFSHIMIAVLRTNGIAARYVSGYIESYNANTDQEMVGFEQSHAWVDVYIPYFSWFGLDPTNNMLSSEQHVRVAVGRDFEDVSPVRGTFKGAGKQMLRVEVKVRRMEVNATKSQDTVEKAV